MGTHLDEMSKRIVHRWSELSILGVDPTPVMIAEWLRLPVGDVEKRMRALAGLQQLPGYCDE